MSVISSYFPLFWAAVAIILAIWYCYYRYCFTYWKKLGVPTLSPTFPAGNIGPSLLGRVSLYVLLQDIYNDFKTKGYKHAGLYFFNGPLYFPIDPEIVRRICVTDFEHFTDRGIYCNERELPLTLNLFTMAGKQWKTLRAKTTPTFSSNKLKSLYKTAFMSNITNMIEVLRDQSATDDKEINSKKIMTCYSADVVTSSAFGINSNILRDSTSKIAQIALNIFKPSLWVYLLTICEGALKNPGNLLKVVHRQKHLETFFFDLVRDMIKLRKEDTVPRNDFFTLLLNTGDLSMNEIVGHCFLFFLAGLETSSQTMTYALHELAYNQEVQTKLRKEIYQNMGTDFTKFDYYDLLKLPYLDCVIKETLRIYPVLGFLNRICTKKYHVPGTDVVIEKGTPVIISMLGLQRDPEYFPEPLEFKPERFSDNNSLIPATYLPFGEGPRICIGLRYGLLLVKLAVAAIVSQFSISPSEKSPRIVEYDKLTISLGMTRRGGHFVKLSKL